MISRRLIQPGAAVILAVALLLSLSAPVLSAPVLSPPAPSPLVRAGDWPSPTGPASGTQLFAQADADEEGRGKLEPRYQPREPEPKSWYNSGYAFGMTRGIADSTVHPAVKAPIFLVTLPLDIVFLPFALIGGMFG
jgi:hypothetical protein